MHDGLWLAEGDCRLAEVPSGELRTPSQLFLDGKKAIELRNAFAAAARARLDMAGTRCDNEIRDECILGLPAAVRDVAAVAKDDLDSPFVVPEVGSEASLVANARAETF